MSSLAIFDFDRTIVDDDSDSTLINRLREKKPPPEWETTNQDWTPYMSDVFEHAYSAGFSQEDILAYIGSMRPNAGIVELITTLAAEGWDILILSDANTVFVQHWLKVNGLLECITSIETNRAFFDNGRLYIEPYMRQAACTRCPSNMCKLLALALTECITSIETNRAFFENGRFYIEPYMRQAACTRCPSNMCKSLALAQWCAKSQPYSRVVYTGDGRNDFCPATSLPPHATVFPRRGYPLDDLIKKTLASPKPLVTAKVVPWDDCFRILHEIFPERNNIS